MSNSTLTSRLRLKERDYLLQTFWLESKKLIVSALFREGKFISQQAWEYANGLSGEEVSRLVKTFHQSKSEEAGHLFELSENPDGRHNEAEVRLLLGEAFYHRQLLEEAEAELKKSLELSPGNPSALELLARIYARTENLAGAEQLLKSAVEQYPDFADFHLLFSQTLAGLQRFSDAVAELEKAIRLNPYYARAYFEYGLVLIQNMLRRKEYELTLGLPEKAVESFNQAARLNPAYANQFFRQGLEFLTKGDYNSALGQLVSSQEKLNGKPKNYLHEYYLNFLYSDRSVDQKSLGQQLKTLQKLVYQNPTYPDLHFQLGTTYMLLCRYITQKAINEYKKALLYNPEYRKAERNMKLCENDIKGMDLLLKAML